MRDEDDEDGYDDWMDQDPDDGDDDNEDDDKDDDEDDVVESSPMSGPERLPKMNVSWGAENGSCAVYGITNLMQFKSPTEAMAAFVKATCLSKIFRWGGESKETSRWTTAPAHISFVSGSEKNRYPYGTEFAKFIFDNQLGAIMSLGKVKNRKHHPATFCQVWVWQPDEEKLKAWWAETGIKVDPDPVPVVIPTPTAKAETQVARKITLDDVVKAYKIPRIDGTNPFYEELNKTRLKQKSGRPKNPKRGDICPGCGKDWGIHAGWLCPKDNYYGYGPAEWPR